MEGISLEAEKLINDILDKISRVGFDKLSDYEKDIMIKYSEGGEDAIQSYIEDEGDDLSFDKYGHILIGGVPYDTYIMNQKKKETERSDGFTETSTGKQHRYGSPILPYIVRVYKNKGSGQRFFFIVWIEGSREGLKQKMYLPSPLPNAVGEKVREKMIKEPKRYMFGYIISKPSWKSKTVDEYWKKLDNEYDMWKDLKDKELSDFDAFLQLRYDYLTEKITKKNFKELQRLYKKFLRI